MNEQATLDFEVDAFMLPGGRDGVQWSIVAARTATGRPIFWHAAMLVNDRQVLWTSLGHRPEQGDGYLRDSERSYFHE